MAVIYTQLVHTYSIITLTALILTITYRPTPLIPSSVYPRQATPLRQEPEDSYQYWLVRTVH